jgi:hypothetical protein
MKSSFPTWLVNMIQIKLSQEQINTLNWGCDYTKGKNPKQFINALIADTGNAIRYPDIKIQNTFRYLAARKIKQITDINTHNTLHKTHEYNLSQIQMLLEQNNMMKAKAENQYIFTRKPNNSFR